MKLRSTLFRNTDCRHAELVSVFMVRGMVIGAKKHILNQTLGAAVINKDLFRMAYLGNNNHNGWRALNPYNAIQSTDIYNERKYL